MDENKLIKKNKQGTFSVDYPKAIGGGLKSALKEVVGQGAITGAIGGLGKVMRKRITPQIPSYKKGGKVKKTGLAMVHKNEIIVPKGSHMMPNGKMMKNNVMKKKMTDSGYMVS